MLHRPGLSPSRWAGAAALCLGFGLAVSHPVAGQTTGSGSLSQRTSDEAEVLATVQKFFDTMAAKDAAGAAEVVDPEGDFVSVRWASNGERIVRRSSMKDYLAGLETETESLLERMWDPEVRIQGPIATVWTPYDFYVDGAFSHCGVDAFELLQTESGWIITGGLYTVERAGCPPSPLGPPSPTPVR